VIILKLYNNYEVTQVVFKAAAARLKNKLTMVDAQEDGVKMGVVTPATPSASMASLAGNDVPIFNVDRLIALTEKLSEFSMLPVYKKSAGIFKHVGIERKYNSSEDVITEFSELSYDQMNYLASVRPAGIKGFLIQYKRLVAQRDELRARDLEHRKLLHEVLSVIKDDEDFESELDHKLLGKLERYSDRQF
jgi:hypothetical protein